MKENPGKYSTIIDDIPALICRFRKDGTLTFVNKFYCEYFKKSREELTGHNFFNFIPEGEREKVRSHYLSLNRQNSEVTYEHKVLSPEGKIRWQKWTDKALFDENGEIDEYQSIGYDITKEKLTEESLRESQEKYNVIFKNTTDYISIISLEGRYIYASPSHSRLGYKSEDLIGKIRDDLIHPDDKKYLLTKVLSLSKMNLLELFKIKERAIADEVEFRFKDSDGNWHVLDTKGSLINSEDGKSLNILLIARDVTERKKIEQSLKESQEKYKELVENINDIYIILDDKGIITYISPQFRKYVDFTEEELISKSFMDLILPEDLPRVVAEFVETITKGREFPTTFRIKGKDGKIYWFEEFGKLFKDDRGNVAGIKGVVRDITERKETEDLYRESEEKYRTLFENTKNAILIADTETGIILDANRYAEKLFGRKRKELIGLNRSQIHPPEEKEYYYNHFRSHVEQGGVSFSEAVIVKKDGTRVPVEISATVMEIQGKKVIQGIFHDMTEKKKAEESLRKTEEKLKVAFENSLDQIFIIDREYRLLAANKTITDFMGKPADEIIGRTVFELNPKNVAEQFVKNSKRVFETGRNKIIEEEIIVGGHKSYNSTNLTPLKDDQGKVIAVMGILRDITDLKKYEELLEQQKKELEKKNVALKEVLAQIETDKKDMEDNIKANIEKTVSPIIRKIRSKTRDKSNRYLKLLEESLDNITSSFGKVVSSSAKRLSPREIEICNMIRNGYKNKQIAKVLGITLETVHTHRRAIRRKLGIKKKSINLYSALQNP